MSHRKCLRSWLEYDKDGQVTSIIGKLRLVGLDIGSKVGGKCRTSQWTIVSVVDGHTPGVNVAFDFTPSTLEAAISAFEQEHPTAAKAAAAAAAEAEQKDGGGEGRSSDKGGGATHTLPSI